MIQASDVPVLPRAISLWSDRRTSFTLIRKGRLILLMQDTEENEKQ
jgi:hypothetical protein